MSRKSTIMVTVALVFMSTLVGAQQPPPKMRPAAALFSDAFEHYRQGRLQDAEALFIAGLKQDDTDAKAWEMLARVQAALDKRADAERSASQAVKRGMPQSQADDLLQALAYVIPKSLPAVFNQCASPAARDALLKIKAPKSGKRFLISYNGGHSEGGGDFQYSPTPGGYDVLIRSGQLIKRQGVVLAGLLSLDCDDENRLEEFKFDGQLFPIREGNKFVLDREQRSNLSRSRFATSCTTGTTHSASEFTTLGAAKDGLVTIFACTQQYTYRTRNREPISETREYKLQYFHELGLFAGRPLLTKFSPGSGWKSYEVTLLP